MLILAYAAEHPETVLALVLIACGAFDPESRERMGDILDQRIGPDRRRRLSELERKFPDPDRRLEEQGRLLLVPYSHDLIEEELPVECDFQAFEESWNDMLRLQQSGVYPAAFKAVQCPVLMLHGKSDPHPGPMIRESLRPFLPQLEYHEWECCGHYPWLERASRHEFLDTLKEWLLHQTAGKNSNSQQRRERADQEKADQNSQKGGSRRK